VSIFLSGQGIRVHVPQVSTGGPEVDLMFRVSEFTETFQTRVDFLVDEFAWFIHSPCTNAFGSHIAHSRIHTTSY